MNAAAVEVMKDLPDLCLAYGVSDEFRYVSPTPNYSITHIYPASCFIPIANSLSVVMGEYSKFVLRCALQ
jgi:hypothetical protein